MKNHAEPFLRVYWVKWFRYRFQPYWSFMLAYFMSRIRIDVLHVDVNDVLPPNGAQILV